MPTDVEAVIATLRIQKRNMRAYLTEPCEKAVSVQPASSLLPQPTEASQSAA